jgi:hypothetical protein
MRELPLGRAELPIIATRSDHVVGRQKLHQISHPLLNAALSADL